MARKDARGRTSCFPNTHSITTSSAYGSKWGLIGLNLGKDLDKRNRVRASLTDRTARYAWPIFLLHLLGSRRTNPMILAAKRANAGD